MNHNLLDALPAMIIHYPLMYSDLELRRKAANSATYSGFPSLVICSSFFIYSSLSYQTLRLNGVLIKPGEIPFTLIPAS